MIKTPKFLTALCGVLPFLVSAEYRTFTDDNVTYGVFHAKPEEVRFHWRDSEGKAYRSLTNLKRALEKDYQVKMIMNAGIYSKKNEPAGLWIENSKILNPLNTRRGSGNFHVQPNGVFALVGKQPYILTTKVYQQKNLKPTFAVQSGPMLLINGKINHQFKPTLESYHKRNAVCLDKQNQLFFILTVQGQPNLYTLSRGLQKIGCYNALYLDGTISNWYIPNAFNSFHWHYFVGMISVTEMHKK
ncbi:phosphodiester glycosidase family protein [Rodentibacter haemolyticus]|uniref:Phosphodiester glycosidase family protein n=1 Tax=Rodentibacter haemolyticus TaxID=2778911 RepID=A0ABX6UXN2_9PAST|nr:phosphodiester glycosidase family protein [Rodentibacter haemolyticus]QPB42123.1 phosphodiester glycosidase family protein [Rodentibacter haemolyticus]